MGEADGGHLVHARAGGVRRGEPLVSRRWIGRGVDGVREDGTGEGRGAEAEAGFGEGLEEGFEVGDILGVEPERLEQG